MRLRSLEIQGFKSFPDKTVLTFGDGITAVVGPNGSGKSNIADAMRWVLGEQSTKNLRGTKMEDVIFGGTQTRKSVGYAHVQLTIDNSDRALPVDDDEVSISRRLYRSGESEYRMGGVMVRLKDIHEMLMDTGLGRDGYSIIGQGRIAEIVSAKSRERREIFEEAAGISKYRYRKEEAERKLAQAEDNLVRLRDILVELEDRVGPLKEQAEKAKSFVTLSDEKKSLEISLWMQSLVKLKEQLSAQEDKLFVCKNQYEELEGESEELQHKSEELYTQVQGLGAEMERKRAEIRELEERAAASDSQVAVMENDIRHNEETVRQIDEELGNAGLGEQALKDQLAAKETQLAEDGEALRQTQGKVEAAQDRLTEQREQVTRVAGEIEALKTKRFALSQAISEAKLAKASSETVLSESIARLEALRESTGAHDSTVEELEKNIEECRVRCAEEAENIQGLENSLRGYTLKREGRAGKLEELSKRITKMESDAQDKLRRKGLLEDLQANMEGFSGSVKYILGQAKKGAIGGVCGAVSELISTGNEYTLAIETALGAAMQNVVVENDGVAKQAIRMLQSNKAGRATFLPLNTVKGSRAPDVSAARRHEGYLGIAADLVQADARYEKVVAQLLGRTCVAEDLDSATAIAKASGYSLRIVTLDGQVVNAGGSFTGGSSGRGTGVLSRKTEIEKLQKQADELQAQAMQLEPERKALTDELGALDASMSGVRGEMQTAQEETVRLQTTLEQLDKNLDNARAARDAAVREVQNLTDRLKSLEGSDASAKQMMEELEAQLSELQEQVQSANSRKEMLNVGAEEAAGALSEMKMAQLAAEKDHELLGQEVERLRVSLESAGTRAQELAARREALVQGNGEIRAKIDAMGEQKEQLRGVVQAQNEAIAALIEQRTALEAQITELRGRERDQSSQREGVARELALLEQKKISLQNEYDGIISKLWDEYELTRSQAAEVAVELENPAKAGRRLGELRSKIRALGTVNVAAIEEYAQVSERYELLSAQVKDAEDSKAKLTELIGELTGDMRELFRDNFEKIAHHFSRIFVQLFGGGRAQLTLTDEEDVLESGVDIYVQPPGKIIKNLTLLSGGEQAFVAIAIYFAILKVRPAPFCLLDEIEAALDDVNVVKFANYLRRMCDGTQFIAITHRRGTMEEADALYGVTMQDEGVSKLLELQVSEVESKLGMEAGA